MPGQAEAAGAGRFEAALRGARLADERHARLIEPDREQRHEHERPHHQRDSGDQGAHVHAHKCRHGCCM